MNFTVFLLKLCPRKNCKSACDCEGSASKIGKNDEQRQSSNWGSITRWVTFESLRSRVKLNLGKRFTQLQCKRYDIDTAKKELNEDVCVEHKRLNHFIHQKECRIRRLNDLCLKVPLNSFNPLSLTLLFPALMRHTTQVNPNHFLAPRCSTPLRDKLWAWRSKESSVADDQIR